MLCIMSIKFSSIHVFVHLKTVNCLLFCSQGCKICPLIVVSCLKLCILQISLKLASIPMVFCFLPGTRLASVTFCMMSACCYTWAITLVWLDMYQYCVSVHFHLSASVFFYLILFFMCETFVLGFASLLSSFVLQLYWACIMFFVVILCADILRENMCCLLFQLQYLPPPWGDCKSTPIDSEYFSTYSITACRIDCETRYLLENCNCRMVHMPGMISQASRLEQLKNMACTCFLMLFFLHYCCNYFDFYVFSHRDLNSLHTWAVQRLCWPSFRWAHALYCVNMKR